MLWETWIVTKNLEIKVLPVNFTGRFSMNSKPHYYYPIKTFFCVEN